MFSLVSPCSATAPLPFLYTGMTQNNLFLITASGSLLQISQGRLVGPLLAAEMGERAAAFTSAALLSSDFVPLGTLYPQQLPG